MARKVFKDCSPRLFTYYNWDDFSIGTEAQLVCDMIDKIDMRAVYATYKGGGASAYDPRALLKGVVLGFLENSFSLRALEKFFRYDTRVQYITGGNTPSFMTLQRLLTARIGSYFMNIFRDILGQLMDKGVIDIEKIFIDGTTIESRASRYSIVWRKTVTNRAKSCTNKIDALIAYIWGQIDDEIMEKDENGVISDRAVEAIKERVSRQQDEIPDPQRKELQETLNKVQAHKADLKRMGTGNSISRTDPAAVAMHPKDDVSKQGMCLAMQNLQLATASHFIVGLGLYSTPNDAATFGPFLPTVLDTSRFLIKRKTIQILTEGIKNIGDRDFFLSILSGPYRQTYVADAIYGILPNYQLCDTNNVTACLKYMNYDYEKELAARRPTTPPRDGDFHLSRMPYDHTNDTFICPARQRLTYQGIAPGSQNKEHPMGLANYRCDHCQDCPFKEQCKNKGSFDDQGRRTAQTDVLWRDRKAQAKILLDSPQGRQLLLERTLEPEPVFSHIKNNHGYKRLRHFNPAHALIDVILQCIARNIAKMASLMRQSGNTGFGIPLAPQGPQPVYVLCDNVPQKISKTPKCPQKLPKRMISPSMPEFAPMYTMAA